MCVYSILKLNLLEEVSYNLVLYAFGNLELSLQVKDSLIYSIDFQKDLNLHGLKHHIEVSFPQKMKKKPLEKIFETQIYHMTHFRKLSLLFEDAICPEVSPNLFQLHYFLLEMMQQVFSTIFSLGSHLSLIHQILLGMPKMIPALILNAQAVLRFTPFRFHFLVSFRALVPHGIQKYLFDEGKMLISNCQVM